MAPSNNPTKNKQALGKGIRALLNNIDEEMATAAPLPGPKETASAGMRIPIELISPNPMQPRRDFDEAALKELSESIRQHDIIQPITLVRLANGTYQLISGERRWRASKMAGLKDIPAYVRTVEDNGLLELALLENLQREDLNAIEIALSYRRLMDECNLTQEGVAERMNKERSTVANYLRLLKLPPDIQKAVRDAEISMGHARALIGLEQVDHQLYAFREVKEKGLSVRQTEALVKGLSEEAVPSQGAVVKKAESKLSPAYKRIEDNMASHFATRVRLERKKNGRGLVNIEFYNDEDLERIMEKMNL
ncbi:MAG: ParB/RepB/Spo0J family partition protein [Bacteroidetes bacterium]|nr:ParB/RepB/Spo0J family partition protein [Bacteroidota bacterium]